MSVSHLRLAALAAVGGLGLSGCAYGMYGDDYGYGYGGYGYPRSGVSVSIGSGYGYGYGSPYGGYGYGSYGYPYGYGYSRYGYGGYDPFGWYGNYYYPGSGIYVYDRNRTRYRWTDQQRRYWQERRDRWRARNGASSTTTSTTENWRGWDRSDRRRGDNAATSNWSRPDRANSGSPRLESSESRATRGEGGRERRSRERADERPD